MVPEPQSDGCEGDGGHEVCRELVEARGDATEVLELVEVALDEVAQTVKMRRHRADDPDVALAGDMGGRTARGAPVDQRRRAVAAIGYDVRCQFETVQQLGRGGLVGDLPRRDDEADGQAVLVDDGVQLGGQSSTRTADGVIRTPFFPPAACWWAFTIEESIR